MKTFNIESFNISVNGATAKELVVGEIGADGKAEKLPCDLTGRKVRYLFSIQKGEEVKTVSAGVLLAAGVSQKQIDKAYSLVWGVDHPSTGTGAPRVTKEAAGQALTEWLS
jgi:hypothetical protein